MQKELSAVWKQMFPRIEIFFLKKTKHFTVRKMFVCCFEMKHTHLYWHFNTVKLILSTLGCLWQAEQSVNTTLTYYHIIKQIKHPADTELQSIHVKSFLQAQDKTKSDNRSFYASMQVTSTAGTVMSLGCLSVCLLVRQTMYNICPCVPFLLKMKSWKCLKRREFL